MRTTFMRLLLRSVVFGPCIINPTVVSRKTWRKPVALTKEQNDRLTRVGPGTPMGELFRRYWLPIAATVEMEEEPVKQVRLLGEDLVVYRDRQGRYGMLEYQCPHRKAALAFGIPEHEGLRCAYHGWMFDQSGQCIEQPAEDMDAPDSTFAERTRIKAYPVQELGGL